MIGLLYENSNNHYVADTQIGASEISQQEGYNIVIYSEDYKNKDFLIRIEEILTNPYLDGLVLTPPFSYMLPLLNILHRKQVNYVRLAPTLKLYCSPCVVSNELHSAYQMTRYLLSLRHTKIGFIKSHPDHAASEQKLKGYLKTHNEAGIEPDKNLIQQGLSDFRSCEGCANKLLGTKNKPTAIFARNDQIASSVLRVAAQKNISVPNELSV